jgi:HSP20 family protein
MNHSEKKELQVTEKKEIERGSGEPTRQGVTFVPDVDILENQEAITLRADLPGVKKENVNINIQEGILTLTATVEPLEKNHQLLYREYDVGGYSRRFTLGERIDQSKITANLENGVLTLHLPKAEEEKPRKIEISSS